MLLGALAFLEAAPPRTSMGAGRVHHRNPHPPAGRPFSRRRLVPFMRLRVRQKGQGPRCLPLRRRSHSAPQRCPQPRLPIRRQRWTQSGAGKTWAAATKPGTTQRRWQAPCRWQKRSYLYIAEDCATQGLQFRPIVGEPSGGWGPSAMCTFKAIAKAHAGWSH